MIHADTPAGRRAQVLIEENLRQEKRLRDQAERMIAEGSSLIYPGGSVLTEGPLTITTMEDYDRHFPSALAGMNLLFDEDAG